MNLSWSFTVTIVFLLDIMIFVKGRTIEFEKFMAPAGPWGRQPILLEEDGGYTNLLVAIHSDVMKTPTIIQEIKEVFTYTSQMMYNMSGQNFFFKSISILVPETWSEESSYERPRPNETIHTARIILRNETSAGSPPSYPFVRRPGRFGVEAEYIYIPKKILTNNSETTLWEAAKVCQSLWGQLRWGLPANWTESSGDQLNFREFEDSQSESHVPREITPSFRLLQPKDLFSVVILDARENMMENEKFNRMIERYRYYIKYLFPTYTWLGVVSVNDTAQQVEPCTKLWEKFGFRKQMTFDLPTRATGTKSLGDAVKKAMQVLNLLDKNITDSIIFIMSDGTDVNSPTIDDVLPEVTSAGVLLATLPFSSNKSENIALNNTIDYNSKIHHEVGGLTSLENEDKFIRIYQSDLIQLYPFELEEFTIETDNIHETQSNLIRVRCDDVTMLQYNYTTSAGNAFIYEDSRSDDNKIADVATSRYDTGEVGRHTLIIVSEISQPVSVEVFSGFFTPGDNSFAENEMTRARVVLELPFINYTTFESIVPLYAVVTKNEKPVANVKIVGLITTPDGNNTEIEFVDDGQGVDEKSDDGIYSHGLDWFTIEGNYSLELFVNGDESYLLIKSSIDSESGTLRRKGLSPFQRIPDTKTFTVVGIPPSTISDLAVGNISGRTVSLNWTAPGADLMTGRATRYDLRYGYSSEEVANNFKNALPVADYFVLSGNLSGPSPGGNLETLNLTFGTIDGATFFLAIIAIDSQGNRGRASNVVEVTLEEVSFETTSSVAMTTKYLTLPNKTTVMKNTFPTKMTKTDSGTTEMSIVEQFLEVVKTNAFLAGVAVGVLVTSVFCIGFCILVRKKSTRRTYQSSQSRDSNTELQHYNYENSIIM
ncbi:Calcium-activated chloride channel regulator 1 [Holothuria leucospilota]|uniref:Calcium-activated chloride channel regulator 1 n=1 Tax=Holothuria leucospilota TaxID=206669 RepID=A0A9Q1HJS3_HOLLE|nr:Calcium-activated chloride channel regulator 1 [Holothuria leucospilota]